MAQGGCRDTRSEVGPWAGRGGNGPGLPPLGSAIGYASPGEGRDGTANVSNSSVRSERHGQRTKLPRQVRGSLRQGRQPGAPAQPARWLRHHHADLHPRRHRSAAQQRCLHVPVERGPEQPRALPERRRARHGPVLGQLAHAGRALHLGHPAVRHGGLQLREQQALRQSRLMRSGGARGLLHHDAADGGCQPCCVIAALRGRRGDHRSGLERVHHQLHGYQRHVHRHHHRPVCAHALHQGLGRREAAHQDARGRAARGREVLQRPDPDAAHPGRLRRALDGSLRRLPD